MWFTRVYGENVVQTRRGHLNVVKSQWLVSSRWFQGSKTRHVAGNLVSTKIHGPSGLARFGSNVFGLFMFTWSFHLVGDDTTYKVRMSCVQVVHELVELLLLTA
jgi:hypothetical protein